MGGRTVVGGLPLGGGAFAPRIFEYKNPGSRSLPPRPGSFERSLRCRRARLLAFYPYHYVRWLCLVASRLKKYRFPSGANCTSTLPTLKPQKDVARSPDGSRPRQRVQDRPPDGTRASLGRLVLPLAEPRGRRTPKTSRIRVETRSDAIFLDPPGPWIGVPI